MVGLINYNFGKNICTYMSIGPYVSRVTNFGTNQDDIIYGPKIRAVHIKNNKGAYFGKRDFRRPYPKSYQHVNFGVNLGKIR